MKKIFFILLAAMLIAGCETKQNKLVIEDDDSRIYLTASQVDSLPRLVNPSKVQELADEISSVFEDHKKEMKENDYAITSFALFIDENGLIRKIKRTPGKMMWANQSEQSLSEIENRLAEIFNKVKFLPAIKDGKPQKYRTGLMLTAILKNSKTVCLLYSDIKGMKTERDEMTADNFSKSSGMPLEATAEYFVAVENPPEPIGGIGAIAANVKYPEIAKRAGIEGRVFIKAFIDENGDVVKTDIIRGIGSGCDEAAANAVMKTKFKPGMQRGKAVKVQVAIPIIFKLQ